MVYVPVVSFLHVVLRCAVMTSNRFALRAISILTVAVAILLSASALVAQDGYKPGDYARDFSLKNIDGSMVSLHGLTNAQGAIVIFTCNHCPYAKKYEDRIIALHNKYANKGYPVVAINPNDPTIQPEDSFTNMVKRAKEKKFPFAYIMDETQEIARTYGATRTPHVYIVERSGSGNTQQWIVRYVGAIDDNSDEPSAVKERYVENAVDALLQRKALTVATTKAIGCTIKWKKKQG